MAGMAGLASSDDAGVRPEEEDVFEYERARPEVGSFEGTGGGA